MYLDDSDNVAIAKVLNEEDINKCKDLYENGDKDNLKRIKDMVSLIQD